MDKLFCNKCEDEYKDECKNEFENPHENIYRCVYYDHKNHKIKITEDKFQTLKEAQIVLNELDECYEAFALVIPNIDEILSELKGIRRVTKIRKRKRCGCKF